MERTCIRAELVASIALLSAAFGGCAAPRHLARDVYLDKCKGAWAGQMIGVCYGAPYEFRCCGTPYVGPLRPWQPARVNGALELVRAARYRGG